MQSHVVHVRAGWQRGAAVEDIGFGGARVLIDDVIVGDAVILSFDDPSPPGPLVLRGRVAWVAPPGRPRAAGVAFELEDSEASLALFELITAL
jgi:Tfp pilus assembly protein PilZ